MRYYSLLICCLLLAAVTSAQTFLPLGHETEWSIVGTGENTMYHSESEAVVPVKEGNSFALIMVDKQTKEKWKTPIGGSILGTSKFNGNFLVLYMKSGKKSNKPYVVISEIFAVVVDPAGKIIQDKSVLQTNANKYVIIKMLTNEQGEFKQLMVRHTKWDGGSMMAPPQVALEKAQTEKIELFDISNELQATQKSSIAPKEDVIYLGSQLLANNELLLFSIKNSNLVVEQMQDGKASTKLSSPVQINEKLEFSFVHAVNASAPNEIFCALNYKGPRYSYIKSVFFDIGNKQVKSSEELLNKEYRRQLEDESEIVGPKKTMNGQNFEELKAVAVAFYNNKPIVVKEMRGEQIGVGIGFNAQAKWFNDDMVISAYDRQAKIEKHFLLDKKCVLTIPAAGSHGSRIIGNKLQVIANTGEAGGNSVIFGELDLDQMKWNRIQRIKVPRNVLATSYPIEAANTIWFPEQIIVAHLNKPMMSSNYKGRIQAASLNQ